MKNLDAEFDGESSENIKTGSFIGMVVEVAYYYAIEKVRKVFGYQDKKPSENSRPYSNQ